MYVKCRQQHVYTHSHTQTYTHAHIHLHAHILYTQARTHTRAHVHTHTLTHLLTHTHTRVLACNNFMNSFRNRGAVGRIGRLLFAIVVAAKVDDRNGRCSTICS